VIDLLASALLLRLSAQSVEVVGFDPLAAGKLANRGGAEFAELAAHCFERQAEKPSDLAAGERTVDVQRIVVNLFDGLMIVIVFSQSYVKA
jgi:hypothetical protein